MAITVNKNTTGAPMIASGKTGSQVVRFIPAPRIYFKNPDSITAAPIQDHFVPLNGTTPASWFDLGIVSGNVKITYDKQTQEILTGIDNYLRAAFVKSKRATIDFELEQFDDVNIERLTSFVGNVITSGSVVNYQLGQEDLIQQAILIVFQNKLDQKEFQFYNPQAYINFVFNDGTNGMTLKVSGILPAFKAQGRTDESFLSMTICKIDSSTVTPSNPPSTAPSNPSNPPVGTPTSVTVDDTGSGNPQTISVSNGTLTVADAGSSASYVPLKLTDTVTGTVYDVLFVDGVMELIVDSDPTGSVSSYALQDTTTGTTVLLSIASGTFMLA